MATYRILQEAGDFLLQEDCGLLLVESNVADSFIEGFDDNALNPALWTSFNGDQIAETGQHLELSTVLAGSYAGVDSIVNYDLTSAGFSIQLVSGGNQSIASLEVYPLQLIANSNNVLRWYLNGGILRVYNKVNSTNGFVGDALTYDENVHRWLRIREASGTVYWDYSADGIDWTNHYSDTVANLFGVTSLQLEITVGTWGVEASTTTMIVDNLNILPQRVTQNISIRANILATTPKNISSKANLKTTYYCGCTYDWNLSTQSGGKNRGWQS